MSTSRHFDFCSSATIALTRLAPARLRALAARLWPQGGQPSEKPQCPLSGVKRASLKHRGMSADDPRRTFVMPLRHVTVTLAWPPSSCLLRSLCTSQVLLVEGDQLIGWIRRVRVTNGGAISSLRTRRVVTMQSGTQLGSD